MMAGPCKVLFAGAGICGLVSALALLRRGIDVTLCEQANELRELGAGLQLSANGTRVLLALGLGPAMERIVCPPSGKEVRLYRTGQTWPLFDLGEGSMQRYGAPYWMVHRGDFHRVLVDAVQALKPDAIRTGARCLGFDQDAGGVTLRLEGGGALRGQALIGTDGMHSKICEQMFGARPAQFLGIAAWRGMVATARLPAHLRRSVGTNWVGPGGHVVTYPVRRGELLNFVGAIERENWQVESWTERGSTQECVADFAGWHPDVRAIAEAIDVPYKWAMLGREPLERWSDGRVCLMGDAAHPTLPFLAQGANMAIEDGYMLARCLDSDEPVAIALHRLERARVARCAAIVRRSSDNARRFHNPSLADPVIAAAYVDREWSSEKIRERYDWLFDYDALTTAL